MYAIHSKYFAYLAYLLYSQEIKIAIDFFAQINSSSYTKKRTNILATENFIKIIINFKMLLHLFI